MTLSYDGILRKPFLSEHIYKGFAAAMAIWLPVFLPIASLVYERFENGLQVAIGVASAVSIVSAFAVWTHHTGFTLEPKQQRYRCYTWVLGLHFGKWKHLPDIARIVIKPYQEQYYLPMSDYPKPMKLGFIATEQSWQVLLSVVGSQVGIVAAYAVNKKAFRIATTLGQLLNVEVLTLQEK